MADGDLVRVGAVASGGGGGGVVTGLADTATASPTAPAGVLHVDVLDSPKVYGMIEADLLLAIKDAIGAFFADSATIDFTYDGVARTLTAILKNGSVSVAMLGFDPATQVELDAVSAAKAPILTPTAVKNADYAAVAGEFVPVDTTGASRVVTLPNAPADGTRVGVKHVIQGAANTVTVNCAGADVFNKAGGGTGLVLSLLNQGMQFEYKASTAVWYVVSCDFSLATLDARFTAASTTVLLSTVTTADDLIVATGNAAVTRLGVAASRIIGKKAAGGIGALTAAEVKAILGAFTDADIDPAAGIQSSKVGTKVLYNLTSTVDTASAAAGAEAAISGLSQSVAVSAKGVRLSFGGFGYNATSTNRGDMRLYRGATQVDALQLIGINAGKTLVDVPGAGTYTYELRVFGSGGTVGHVLGTATSPVRLLIEDA